MTEKTNHRIGPMGAFGILCAAVAFFVPWSTLADDDPVPKPESDAEVTAEESEELSPETYDEAFKDGEFIPDPGIHYGGEVVVTGRREANIEQAGTTLVIDREDIKAHGDRTLGDVLGRIPGIQVYTHTKGHERIKLRGFDQDKVIILIDGMPLNDVYSTDTNLGAIPLVNVSRIVVNRGVASALYGGEGAMGTINVITRKPPGPFAEISTEYSTGNTVYNTLVLGGRLGNFYFVGTGSMLHSKGFAPSTRLDSAERRRWFDKLIRYDLYPLESPYAEGGPYYTFNDIIMPTRDQYILDEGAWNHQEMRKYQLSAKVGYSLGSALDAGISAEYYHFKGETNTYEANGYNSYRGNAWKPSYPYFGNEPLEAKKFALRNRSFVWPRVYRFNVQPFVRGQIGWFSVNFQAFYLQQGQTEDGYASNDHLYPKGESTLLHHTGVVEPFHDHKMFRSVGFRLLPSIEFAEWHRLTLAVHWRMDRYLSEESAISSTLSPSTYSIMGGGRYPAQDLGAKSLSLAIEDEMKLFDRLKLAAGASYDVQFFDYIKMRDGQEYVEAYRVRDESTIMGTRDAFNPVAGLVFDPIKRRLRFRVAGAMKTRFPTLSEYAKVEEEALDRDLRPERSYNVNAGAEVFLMDTAVSLRSDYFASIIDDRIVKFRKDDPPVNVDKMVAQGLETTLTAELGKIGRVANVVGSLGHAYVHARYKDFDPNQGAVKGPYVEFTPEHHFSADLLLEFDTGTSFETWAVFLLNQKIYVMDHRPLSMDVPFDTDYFTTVDLHNPFYWNIKVSQRFARYYEASFSVHNILDDYNMDPFNPGPGRQFFLELSARWE